MPEINVQGMSCEHCRAAVTKALGSFAGLEDISVDLVKGVAAWRDKDPKQPADLEKIREAVRKIGFDA